MVGMNGEGWDGEESGRPSREGGLSDTSSNSVIEKTPDTVVLSRLSNQKIFPLPLFVPAGPSLCGSIGRVRRLRNRFDVP
jgi:hypothetical protein